MTLKILWISDSPAGKSAYSGQTALVVPALIKLGYDVIVYSPAYRGTPYRWNGIPIVGGRDALYGAPFGEDLINDHCEKFDRDIIISLKDAYSFTPALMKAVSRPWFPIVPVDSRPLAPVTRRALDHCTQPIALTHHGERELGEAGFKAAYIPHMVNPEIFHPGDMVEARKKLGIPQEIFFASFVGDNNTDPPRKNIEPMIAAFSHFLDTAPDAGLMLHTDMTPDRGGVDLIEMVKAYGLSTGRNIFTINQYQYAQGLPTTYLADLYRASNVVFSVGNEGFGLPTVEAQLCGTSVIGINFAATPELMRLGILIGGEKGQPQGELYFNIFGSFYYRPHTSAVYAALRGAYEDMNKPRPDSASVAASLAEFYPANVIPLWDKWLKGVEELLEGKA